MERESTFPSVALHKAARRTGARLRWTPGRAFLEVEGRDESRRRSRTNPGGTALERGAAKGGDLPRSDTADLSGVGHLAVDVGQGGIEALVLDAGAAGMSGGVESRRGTGALPPYQSVATVPWNVGMLLQECASALRRLRFNEATGPVP